MKKVIIGILVLSFLQNNLETLTAGSAYDYDKGAEISVSVPDKHTIQEHRKKVFLFFVLMLTFL